jgi:hypothetical protein
MSLDALLAILAVLGAVAIALVVVGLDELFTKRKR